MFFPMAGFFSDTAQTVFNQKLIRQWMSNISITSFKWILQGFYLLWINKHIWNKRNDVVSVYIWTWDTFQMKHKIQSSLFFLALFSLMIFTPNPALATQGHGGIEGVYAHQIAHIFFIISMGGLIYWLRQRGLVRERGWQLIRLSAFFFILWNLDNLPADFKR